MKNMITVLDYGMGNFGSILNMLKLFGVNASIQSDPKEISKSTKLILPGVGSFDAAMNCINKTPGLLETLNNKAVVEKIPVLGVCLGMQLLTNKSEEGVLNGLGWISGNAVRLPTNNGMKVPHMGWNIAKPRMKDHSLMINVGEEPRYYFVHSYAVHVTDPANSLMQTHYGIDFDSAIVNGNILGVQFHPEKSHRYGMQILKNFAEL
jgi:glutamine amidotransferase